MPQEPGRNSAPPRSGILEKTRGSVHLPCALVSSKEKGPDVLRVDPPDSRSPWALRGEGCTAAWDPRKQALRGAPQHDRNDNKRPHLWQQTHTCIQTCFPAEEVSVALDPGSPHSSSAPEAPPEAAQRMEPWSLPPGQTPFGVRSPDLSLRKAGMLTQSVRGVSLHHRTFLPHPVPELNPPL